MDLSSNFDIPNPYGLRATDFNHQLDSYIVALKFLGDLATGTPEDKALEQNGGTKAMVQAWQRSDNFRHVLSKCRKANAGHAVEDAQSAPKTTESFLPPPGTQRFVSIDEMVQMMPRVGFRRNFS